MARARNIKPSTFKNELLGQSDPLLTILFISLWCLADRDGKLEDRPLRIKIETFPYRENIDINGYLTELQRLGFICRYKVNGFGYILILKFKEHQSPHNTEKPSTIPDPEEIIQANQCIECLTVISPLNNEDITQAKRSDSLIPDCGIMKEDSLIADTKTTRKRKTTLPENFKVSDRVLAWAKEKSHDRLDEHLEYFLGYAKSSGNKYLDWDEALMNCIRGNWAKLKDKPAHHDKHNGFANKDYTKGATKLEDITWMDENDRT